MSDDYKKPILKFSESLHGFLKLEQKWRRCVRHVKELFYIAVRSMLARKERSTYNYKEIRLLITSVKDQVKAFLEKVPITLVERNELTSKMTNIEIIVGYPEEYFDDSLIENYYDGLNIKADNYFKTVYEVKKISVQRNADKLSKPVQDTKWQSFFENKITSSTYSLDGNYMFISHGDLKTPLYDENFPIYLNYAGLGWRVGVLFGIALVFEVTSISSLML